MNHTCNGDVFERHGKRWMRCLGFGTITELTGTEPADCPRCQRPWRPTQLAPSYWNPDTDLDVKLQVDLPHYTALASRRARQIDRLMELIVYGKCPICRHCFACNQDNTRACDTCEVVYEIARETGVELKHGSENHQMMSLPCAHCGGPAIESPDGIFVDGQGDGCGSCGFPGQVSCDVETEPYWETSVDPEARCEDTACADCLQLGEKPRPWHTKQMTNEGRDTMALIAAEADKGWEPYAIVDTWAYFKFHCTGPTCVVCSGDLQ